MKTSLIRYIALLLVSGVIIPLCQQLAGAVKTAPVINPVSQTVIDSPLSQGETFSFSFAHDVAAKILPVINFFK